MFLRLCSPLIEQNKIYNIYVCINEPLLLHFLKYQIRSDFAEIPANIQVENIITSHWCIGIVNRTVNHQKFISITYRYSIITFIHTSYHAYFLSLSLNSCFLPDFLLLFSVFLFSLLLSLSLHDAYEKSATPLVYSKGKRKKETRNKITYTILRYK